MLDNLRQQIDGVDQKILKLLQKRQQLVNLVAEYKREHRLAIFQPKREKELMLKRLRAAKVLGLNKREVKDFFNLILAISKQKQRKVGG